MLKGLKPTWKHAKDKRFSPHVVFGAVFTLPDELSTDAGLTMPDQNEDGRPTECTGYCTTDTATDDDKTVYSPSFNYMKTLEVQNLPPNTEGADARTATQIGTTFGFLPKTFEPPTISTASQAWAANQANWPVSLDKEALNHKRPAYLPITKVPGMDWFDSVRSAMAINGKRSAMLATRWSPDFEHLGSDSILSETPKNLYWGHDYKAAGFTTKNTKGQLIRGGEVFLKIKSWQGKGYGDQGWCYMSRAMCNLLLAEWGTFPRTFALLSENTIDNLKSQKTDYIQIAIALIQNLLGQLRYKLGMI